MLQTLVKAKLNPIQIKKKKKKDLMSSITIKPVLFQIIKNQFNFQLIQWVAQEQITIKEERSRKQNTVNYTSSPFLKGYV